MEPGANVRGLAKRYCLVAPEWRWFLPARRHNDWGNTEIHAGGTKPIRVSPWLKTEKPGASLGCNGGPDPLVSSAVRWASARRDSYRRGEREEPFRPLG